MLHAVRTALWALARLILWLRYRVHTHGLEQLRDLKGPVLVLPNHPGLIDPPLVLRTLWPVLHPRPMLFEGIFQNPVLYPFMKLLNALRVPDLSRASGKARAQAEQAVSEAIEALRRGENVILWPAGHIQHAGAEVLGGVRATSDILKAVPGALVVLVRTRGVWGSSFSFAPTGEHPHLGRELWAGIGWILANLVLFTPRRRVDMTFERVDRSRLPELRRETLNPWLEAWYNDGGPETPTFVPYHFLFGRRTYDFPRPAGLAGIDLGQITQETRTEVAHILERRLHRQLTESELKPEATLDQLGLDSLDRMGVALDVEQRFGFSSDEVPSTLGGFWALAQGLAESGPVKPAPAAWFRPAGGGRLEILGDTIAEAFVARALAGPRDVVAADDTAGVVTYQRMLTGALLISRRLSRLPGTHVGLMLPASVACDTAMLAIYLAGKVPVVLNWTTGPANLAHAARMTGLTHVVTSSRFIDRTGIVVEGVSYLYLEELRRGIGRWELLRTLLRVRLRPGAVRRRVPRVDPDQHAVVLFTSGSEKAPKAVPLTHRNLLVNQKAALVVLGATRGDSVLGFLPAFHSFGLSATGLLPVLAGMRVVHHPDPTAASSLARKIAAYRPTIMVGTPTFASYIVDRAQPGQLDSLRLIIVGAEKCPPSLYERCARKAPSASLLEGYGITECSPVVAANRPGHNRPGTLGQPLPGVEVCVTDLETDAVLPTGQMGMLLVSGQTVFPGYLGDEASPFRELNGKRWYVTGDLATIDADGFIHFAGRLKRFLKAGGEMISLPALEEPFTRRYPPTREGPRVAVEGVEQDHGGRRIVLFTTEPLTVREANELLLQEGFRGVLRLDEVRRVEAIPVLGTGKTDYKVLRRLITESGQPAETRQAEVQKV